MRILINAASSKMGGALSYLQHVLPVLAERGKDEICAVVPPSTLEVLGPMDLPERLELMPLPERGQGKWGRFLYDQIAIPRMIRDRGIDVLFSATGFGTFRPGCPQILLLRNAAYFDPAYWNAARLHGKPLRGLRARRWHSIASALAADHLIFPTNAMRQLCGGSRVIARKPQSVIPYGLNESAVRASGPPPAWSERIDAWREEGASVLLCVGDYAIHKNMETLVEALDLLRRDGMNVRCVTTMSRSRTGDTGSWDRMMKRVRELRLEENFISVGYVPASALAHLYGRADLFVFPSVSESFGHPLVEAMGNGLPVLASDIGTHREVCEEAAVYFSPHDGPQLAREAGRLLNDRKALEEPGLKGRQRAGLFSWEKHSEKLRGLMLRLSRRTADEPGEEGRDAAAGEQSAAPGAGEDGPAHGDGSLEHGPEQEEVRLHG